AAHKQGTLTRLLLFPIPGVRTAHRAPEDMIFAAPPENRRGFQFERHMQRERCRIFILQRFRITGAFHKR
ncbi:MAG: hypothetical protein LUF91_04995, partial [Oscillospiraceae bacterium]|nr:hypothetical protein [Oscillospiraceae bacterium]